jgi:hypothetical protein
MLFALLTRLIHFSLTFSLKNLLLLSGPQITSAFAMDEGECGRISDTQLPLFSTIREKECFRVQFST